MKQAKRLAVTYLVSKGKRDANQGIRPNQTNKHYLHGYSNAYARQFMNMPF